MSEELEQEQDQEQVQSSEDFFKAEVKALTNQLKISQTENKKASLQSLN